MTNLGEPPDEPTPEVPTETPDPPGTRYSRYYRKETPPGKGKVLGENLVVLLVLGGLLVLILAVIIAIRSGDDDTTIASDCAEQWETAWVDDPELSRSRQEFIDECVDAAEPEAQDATQLQTARDAVALPGYTYFEITDGGYTLVVDGAGSEDSGASLRDITELLTLLDVPGAVTARMDATRALDGTQSAEWDDLSATWTYHPDNGLDIVIEDMSGR